MRNVKNGLMVMVISLLSLPAMSNGIKFEKISLKAGLEKAKKENKKVFIDIFATWCGPCKYLSRSVFIDEKLGEFMNANFINLKLDGELKDGGMLMEKFELSAYPTMLFLDTDLNLLKKIEGAVGADDILETGNGVVHPETTKLFKLQQQYAEGSRSKVFLQELITETLQEDKVVEILVDEYVSLFPTFDLTQEGDFLLFCLASEELSDGHVQLFLEDIEKYEEIHGEIVETKLIMLVRSSIDRAIENADPTLLNTALDKLYPSYKKLFKADASSKAELLEQLHEVYQDEMNE